MRLDNVIRITLLSLLATGCWVDVHGQQLTEWYRVYTFDESFIEMNTTNAVLGGDIGRVQFRWVFDQPQSLSSQSQLKYKTRLETIEFRCVDSLYRIFEMSFIDESGKVLQSVSMSPPYQWRPLGSHSVMTTVKTQACELINRETNRLTAVKPDTAQIEQDRTLKFALSFFQNLEEAKDFTPIIEKFFAPNYLNGYLHDDNEKWFVNLDRDTAMKASRVELQKYYVAILNAAYLSSLYFLTRAPASDLMDEVSEEKLVPNDLIELINNHPYAARYGRHSLAFDYLAEQINSIERMRSYTDLMMQVASWMRSHVAGVNVKASPQYQELMEESPSPDPHILTCAHRCLGRPRGTQLIEVNLPIFRLQLVDINGQMKIVSILDRGSSTSFQKWNQLH